MIRHLFLIFIFLFSIFTQAQSPERDTAPETLYNWIDAELKQGLSEYNIPAISFSIVQKDSLNYTKTYGVEKVGSTDISTNSSVFHVASISKTFVAVAIMQLVEQDKIDLDSNINTYLNKLEIEVFEKPISIKNLLQHTAGFDERNLYTTVLNEKDVISLENHLQHRMPPSIRDAGKTFTYSNYGFALLGLIVENVSGLAFDDYITKNILVPLEMKKSGFKTQIDFNYIPSYLQSNNELIPYRKDFPLNYPASSFSTTASDMNKYISFLLNNGSNSVKPILSKESLDVLFNSEFKHFKEAENGYSFGFFTSEFNGYKRVGHTGVKQGFASDLTLIPGLGIGLFICVNASKYPNSNTRKFINAFIQKLLDKLIVENYKVVNKSVKINESEINLSEFEGNYRFTRYAQTTLDKLGVIIGLAPEINVLIKNNKLSIPKWDLELDNISGNTFYDFKKEKYISFDKNEKGSITYLFSSGTSSYHKLNWYENISFQINWIGGILIVLVLNLFICLFKLIFKRKSNVRKICWIEFGIAMTILLGLTLLGYVLITTDPQQFVYGVPLLLKIALILPFLTIIFQFMSLRLLIGYWRSKKIKGFRLVYHSFLFCISIGIIPWWIYWNLLGFNY